MVEEIAPCVAYAVPDGTWTVTQLLDEGSEALRYFEGFAPCYQRWVGNPPANIKNYEELHALFYAQNGLDEQRFRDLAGALADVLSNADAQHAALSQLAQNLPSVWSGESASNASVMFAEQLSLSADDIVAARSVYQQFEKAPTALRAIIRPKAEMVDEIMEATYKVTYKEKSPEDVDSIISAAQGIGWSTSADGDLLGKIKNIFPDEVGGQLFSVPGINGDVEDYCRDWLNGFKSEYELKVAHFILTCTDVNDGVKTQYDTLIGLLGKFSEKPYPCPQGIQQAPSTPGGTPSPQTPSAAPSGTPTGTETPTTTDNPQVSDDPDEAEDPASTDNPLSSLVELGTQLASSELGTQIASGLSQLVSSATEQISGTLEQLLEQAAPDEDLDGDGQPDEDRDGDGQPDDTPDSAVTGGEEDDQAAGVELNGKDYKLELGPDGQLRLVVSAEGSEPENYRIVVGPDGKPSIVSEDPQGAESETESDNGTPTTDDQGTDQPSGAPGAPSGKKTEDDEHQPQDYPAPVQDDPPVDGETAAPDDAGPGTPDQPPVTGPQAPPTVPPVDTGAQLAEAGPL